MKTNLNETKMTITRASTRTSVHFGRRPTSALPHQELISRSGLFAPYDSTSVSFNTLNPVWFRQRRNRLREPQPLSLAARLSLLRNRIKPTVAPGANREAAEVLGVSERTVERAWRFAKAWLPAELGPDK